MIGEEKAKVMASGIVSSSNFVGQPTYYGIIEGDDEEDEQRK